MADEIVELPRRIIGEHSDGTPLLALNVLFLYDLASDPIVMKGGTKFALTPRSGLPPIVREYLLLSEDEMIALDAGDLAFWVEPVEQQKDEHQLEGLARVLRLYVKRGSFVEEARSNYAKAGKRYDAA